MLFRSFYKFYLDELRKQKPTTSQPTIAEVSEAAQTAKKKRGRPAKIKPEDKKEQPMTIDPEKTAKIKQQPEEKQEKAPEQEKRQRASKKKVKKALDLNIDDIEIYILQ